MAQRGLVVLCLWLAGSPGTIAAHPAGVTVTDLFLGAQRVELVYTVPAEELWRLKGGQRPAEPPPPSAYAEAVSAGFQLTNDGTPCDLNRLTSRRLTEIGSYEYRLRFGCPRPLGRLGLDYDLFVGFDRGHRNITRAFVGDLGNRTVLHHRHRRWAIPVGELLDGGNVDLPHLKRRPQPPRPAPPPAAAFFRMGAEHILTGYDHLLFLAGLLVVTLRFAGLALLVTAFTIAHSITLGLAALGWVLVPSWLTESLIALSVAWIGAANLMVAIRHAPGFAAWRAHAAPALRHWARGASGRRWGLTFGIGLIHGVGFAGILRETGLPPEATLTALGLFNAGVEVGQLAAVAAAFPLVLLVARSRLYPGFVVTTSAALTVTGLVWFIQRAVF